MSEYLSCPKCGSTDLNHKGRREVGSEFSWFRCKSCGHRWKIHTGSDQIEPVRVFRVASQPRKGVHP